MNRKNTNTAIKKNIQNGIKGKLEKKIEKKRNKIFILKTKDIIKIRKLDLKEVGLGTFISIIRRNFIIRKNIRKDPTNLRKEFIRAFKTLKNH
jgi:hypothetical protein